MTCVVFACDSRVRMHAVLAFGFGKSEKALETALEAANHKMDPGLDHALNETLDYQEHIKRPAGNP